MKISSALLLSLVTLTSTVVGQEMQYPLSVAGKGDTIYVADRNLPGIWKLEGGKAQVFFQGSRKFGTPLNAVRCVALDRDGHLLAGDSSTRDIYRFDDDNKPVPLTGGKIGIPMSIAVAEDGSLYVADLEVHRIWKVPAGGGEPVEFAVINSPRGLAFDASGRLWILSTSSKDGQIQRADKAGKLETVVAGRPFQLPHNIVVMDDGTAYVTDNYAGAVWKVPSGGKPEIAFQGEPLQKPVGLARIGSDLVIADPHARAIFRTVDGKLTTLYAAGK